MWKHHDSKSNSHGTAQSIRGSNQTAPYDLGMLYEQGGGVSLWEFHMLASASRLARRAARRASWLIRWACVVLAMSITTTFAELPARLQEAERLLRAGEYDAAHAVLPDLPSQPDDERYRGLMLREGVSTSDERRRLCA